MTTRTCDVSKPVLRMKNNEWKRRWDLPPRSNFAFRICVVQHKRESSGSPWITVLKSRHSCSMCKPLEDILPFVSAGFAGNFKGPTARWVRVGRAAEGGGLYIQDQKRHFCMPCHMLPEGRFHSTLQQSQGEGKQKTSTRSDRSHRAYLSSHPPSLFRC